MAHPRLADSLRFPASRHSDHPWGWEDVSRPIPTFGLADEVRVGGKLPLAIEIKSGPEIRAENGIHQGWNGFALHPGRVCDSRLHFQRRSV